jgi:uncharacterized protein
MSTITETVAQDTIHLVNSPVPLDVSRPKKTLDFGSDGVVCSIGSLGDIISLSAYHPRHGIVVANPFEQFPGGDKFWDASFVRAYRKKVLDFFERQGSGFGLKVSGPKEKLQIRLTDGRWPRIACKTNRVELESHFRVTGGPNPTVVNILTATNPTNSKVFLDIEFGGNISVNRASYGQLTETGPVPIPPCVNRLKYQHGILSIENTNLSSTFYCALYSDKNGLRLHGLEQESPLPINVQHPFRLEIAPYGKRQLTALFRLDQHLASKCLPKRFIVPSWDTSDSSGFVYHNESKEKDLNNFVIRRALDYIVSCCCIPINGSAICVLTDHIALPLGWNRDN